MLSGWVYSSIDRPSSLQAFLCDGWRLKRLRRTLFAALTPAPPNVSCVVCDHWSPSGPSPCPCPGVDTPPQSLQPPTPLGRLFFMRSGCQWCERRLDERKGRFWALFRSAENPFETSMPSLIGSLTHSAQRTDFAWAGISAQRLDEIFEEIGFKMKHSGNLFWRGCIVVFEFACKFQT